MPELSEPEILANALQKHGLNFQGYPDKDLLALIRYARLIGYGEGWRDHKEFVSPK